LEVIKVVDGIPIFLSVCFFFSMCDNLKHTHKRTNERRGKSRPAGKSAAAAPAVAAEEFPWCRPKTCARHTKIFKDALWFGSSFFYDSGGDLPPVTLSTKRKFYRNLI
jgi:hypothetical protein